jgi:hypothetical protein
MVLPMKYRDVLTVVILIGFFLSIGYAWGVSKTIWFWIVPLVFLIALIWTLYYLWLT